MHTINDFFKKVDPGDFSELHEELKQVQKIYSEKYEQLNLIVTQRIFEYDFYRSDDTFKDLITAGVMNIDNYKNTDAIIRYIETNNESTLIGTLNFMNFITVINNETPLICGTTSAYNPMDDIQIQKFVDIPRI